MGLDTYASRTPGDVTLTDEDDRAFADAKIELCGGMFSGDDGSFRGKLYASLVLEVTGVSLFAEWIAPETVGQMADALEACDPVKAVENERGLVADDVTALARFFRLCANRGLGLIGWW